MHIMCGFLFYCNASLHYRPRFNFTTRRNGIYDDGSDAEVNCNVVGAAAVVGQVFGN